MDILIKLLRKYLKKFSSLKKVIVNFTPQSSHVSAKDE